MYINERLPKHEMQINSEVKRMGMITSTKNCEISVMIRKSQNEASFQPVNYVTDLNKINNSLLRDSVRGISKLSINYSQAPT